MWTNSLLWALTLPQKCCWKLKSSEMWRRIIGWGVTSISKADSAFIFRVKQSLKIRAPEYFAKLGNTHPVHRGTSWTMWIFAYTPICLLVNHPPYCSLIDSLQSSLWCTNFWPLNQHHQHRHKYLRAPLKSNPSRHRHNRGGAAAATATTPSRYFVNLGIHFLVTELNNVK
jgi:hypothetical protein